MEPSSGGGRILSRRTPPSLTNRSTLMQRDANLNCVSDRETVTSLSSDAVSHLDMVTSFRETSLQPSKRFAHLRRSARTCRRTPRRGSSWAARRTRCRRSSRSRPRRGPSPSPGTRHRTPPPAKARGVGAHHTRDSVSDCFESRSYRLTRPPSALLLAMPQPLLPSMRLRLRLSLLCWNPRPMLRPWSQNCASNREMVRYLSFDVVSHHATETCGTYTSFRTARRYNV